MAESTIKKIVVGTTNPAKLNAVRVAFQEMFPSEHFDVSGIAVASGVSDQPMSDEETLQGARNRAHNARQEAKDADFWVGVEGGVHVLDPSKISTFAWIVVIDRDTVGEAKSASFLLPPKVAALVSAGTELGTADDIIFGTENSKQAGGAVGLLTEGVITRSSLYSMAVSLALIPWKNPWKTAS